ncbi:ATP-binding protein [Acidisoma cladoniae]|uniref:ATP-binding protein n=1 Tax=Acidisoma cladoniae TaxID=3040935 RepID=UPI00254D5931|nr:ATP-binding protein [Acidisoma sp. PAMC 29798]
MSDTTAIAPLRVANEAFLVASMIERCPKTMMLRELVVNGLEAAAHAVTGGKRVVIASRKVDGVRKLCIWNTGHGLSAAELLHITDLASSLRKINSLDQNFGMGAKVASLPSNRHGLRYRSCQDGRVSEVMLGYREGIYGRLRIGPEGREVVDATQTCLGEQGYDLSYDWTEVLLCGNAAAQDTVADPYAGTPRVNAFWVPHYLANRFFRLPPDVSLSLMPEVTGGTGPRDFIGLDDRRDDFGQTETRSTPSGVKIHYYFDPPQGESTRAASGAIAPSSSRSSVVFRGEMYDVREGEQWLADAPVYGIPFGAKYCFAFVELPDDYLVWPEAYRQFLRLRGGHQRQVFLNDFSPLVRAYMPPWLVRIIQSFGPSQANYLGEISEELKALLAELGVPPEQRGLPIPGASLPAPKVVPPAAPTDRDEATPPQMANEKPPAPPKPKTFEAAPEIIGLRSAEMIAERALQGRAAKFYPQSHQVFVNLMYPAVGAMAAQLEQEHGETEDPETARRVAAEVSEWCITKKVTRAVVYSLAKKGAGWRPEDVTRSQSPECLSLVADDWSGLMEMARLRFSEMLATQGAVPITVAA